MSAMWKRVISMMLVCTMLLPMTPLTVLAESLEEHEHDHEHADDLVGAQVLRRRRLLLPRREGVTFFWHA